MPSFTLKIGALDLSPYVRMQPGEGFDPADSGGYLQPGFISTPYYDGEQLSSVNAQNRKITIPLALHGSLNTKDQVHTLIQQINNALGASGLIPVEWKDTGATNSSFLTLVFGRLDVDFSYWRAASGWIFGALHLWVRPYADTGTTRIIATGAGSGALFSVPIPSPIQGDVQALLDVRLTEGSYFAPQGRILGVAAIPHASYCVRVPVASFLNVVGATVVGASGADGSQALACVPGASPLLPWHFQVALSPASVYAGQSHRLLVPARRGVPLITLLRADYGGQQLGPTSLATAADWAFTDLGILRIPSVAAATLIINVRGGFSSDLPPIFQDGPPQISTPTHQAQLGPLIILPENNLAILTDSQRLPIANDLFPPSASTADLRNRQDQFGNQWATALIPGPVGGFTQSSGTTWEGDIINPPVSTLAARALNMHTPALDLLAEARVRTAGVGAPVGSTAVGLFKQTTASQMIEGAVGIIASGFPTGFLAITLNDGGATSLLASNGLTGSHLLQDWTKVSLQIQGPVVSFSVAADATVSYGTTMASVGASHAQAAIAGRAGIYVQGVISPAGGAYVRNFRVTSLPSRAQGASDLYEIDQVGQSITRTSGVNVDSISERVRGRIKVLPSTVALAAISASIDKGPMNDLLSVDIRVRERFQYSR